MSIPLFLIALTAVEAAEFTPDGLEFFEKRVRPLLVERCYKCHSATSEKLKGEFRLDSREAALKGGESGQPAIIPGDPEKSRLVEAIRYGKPDFQMPPKNKLSDAEIADLIEWVKQGAPWPQEAAASASGGQKKFDLEKRKQEHWCWQPIRASAPPAVRDATWPLQPVDAFILARLEQASCKPAPPAEKRTLLRRLYFDLIGLPPTAAAVDAFVNDAAADAYEKVVDRLLASPRFGERWARHWLDLVRYSETLGHEFDYPIHNAWRYRDYVIRALNADVPYNQFALEHIAGDLLHPPRRHPDEGFNESIIGTAFYWLGQREHSPVDVRLHGAEVVDNQIDVLSKTFLGVTVACARCHDHKFDAIATRDYYSLYGVLGSSRYAQRSVEAPKALEATTTKLTALQQQIREAVAARWSERIQQLPAAMLATNIVSAPADTRSRTNSTRREIVFADFDQHGFEGWFVDGEAFGSSPVVAGDFLVGNASRPIAALFPAAQAHSARLSRRLQGALRSPTFTITNRYIHLLAAGRESRINVPVDNFTMIRDPIYGGLKKVLNSDEAKWVTVDAEMWRGHRAYLEFSDVTTPDPSDDGHKSGFAADGWVSANCILFSENAQPPKRDETAGPKDWTRTNDVEQIRRELLDAMRNWPDGSVSNRKSRAVPSTVWPTLNRLIRAGLLDVDAKSESAKRLAALVEEYHRLEAAIPDPARVPTLTEGTGLDAPVFIRGNHLTPGEMVPRQFLEALGGSTRPAFKNGSGRLDLARAVTDPSNPLFARVMVNRVWLHLFGRGIVPTPDDFGVLGQPPTHPELLDWLAHWFRGDGAWSTKKLARLLVTSRAYRMSSKPDDGVAEEKDPGNLLWHRMNVRRLEGEAIRDAILALSGRLEPTMFGPPVPIHLTEFMDGRGRPGKSGPLDGAGRRTVYVEVRRNFVSPMMRTFDTPVPHSTVGRRTVSNVPAQSLILMNDPFVVGEAQRWAKSAAAAQNATPQQRIRDLYRSAFSRPPTESELADAMAFLHQQSETSGLAPEQRLTNEQIWSDLCHVLLNVKEFVFVH